MFDLYEPDPQGFLYLVTDSHLDRSIAPYTEFVQFLDQLPEVHTLICLGDLFKVWLADRRFWTPVHREVLQAFERLKKRAKHVILIAGNREFLLPKNLKSLQKSDLPFTEITDYRGFLTWRNIRLGMEHGDRVNPLDSNYLRWRAISHSWLFETGFRCLPSMLVLKLSENLEAQMAQSNQAFKVSFPEAEIERFARTVLPEVDEYFLGHFHLEYTFNLPGSSKTLHVIPDWLGTRKYWKIDPVGNQTVEIFEYFSSSCN